MVSRTRDILNTPERAARRHEKRKRHHRFVVALGVLVLIVIGLLAWGAHQPSVRISTVAVEGNTVVASADVERAVREALSGKYVFLFPRDNAFIYSDSALEGTLAYQFKNFKTVKVSLSGLTGLTVSVTEREPKALWCGTTARTPAAGCSFVDADGLVYATAPDFSPGAYVALYGPLTATDLADPEMPLGYAYLDRARLTALFALITSVNDLVAPVHTFALEGDRATMTLATGATIMLTANQEFGRLPELLVAAVNAKKDEGKDMATLDYLDLRLAETAGKIYFKFK